MKYVSQVYICLHPLAPVLRLSASACSLFFDYGKKNSTRRSKRREDNRQEHGAKVLCTDGLTHEGHERQGIFSAPARTQGTERDWSGGHGILFDVHVRGKREAGRLLEYRLKGVDTHWLSVTQFRVNMTHRRRPLR